MEYLKPDVWVAIPEEAYRQYISVPVADHFHFPESHDIACLDYNIKGETFGEYMYRLTNYQDGRYFVFRPMFSADEITKELVWMLVDGHHPGINVWIDGGEWVGTASV